MLSLLLTVVTIAAAGADPASDQLIDFKNRTYGPIGIMTTSNGAPVEIRKTVALNSRLIFNEFFMESMSHLVRERIPERVVHTKGAGAFGYFQVTHNVTDICKAKFLSKIGKRTPVAVRFSPSSFDKGQADTVLDSRGFAVKFYTEEGNFDMVGLHTPMFSLKDPITIPGLVKVIKRNPVTNLKDYNMLWNFITLRPETVFFFMYILGDNGIPDGFRYMPGFSIHTYQVHNKRGKSYLCRFHFTPDLGIKNIYAEKAMELSATDPDYAGRDLYNAIEKGEYPSWTVYVQVLTFEDARKAKFDVFDITKVLPLSQYPLRPVGKFFLNKNPDNFFADIEQLAFCPGNLVPGILGAPDKMFESRRMAYRDAQFYRLGVNFDKILVNCPFRNVLSYNRDGVAPVNDNGGGSPNYFPNSFHGPVPYVDKNCPTLVSVTHDDSYNFEQAASLYNEMTKEERSRMIANIVLTLRETDEGVQQKVVRIFNIIHPHLGFSLVTALAKNAN